MVKIKGLWYMPSSTRIIKVASVLVQVRNSKLSYLLFFYSKRSRAHHTSTRMKYCFKQLFVNPTTLQGVFFEIFWCPSPSLPWNLIPIRLRIRLMRLQLQITIRPSLSTSPPAHLRTCIHLWVHLGRHACVFFTIHKGITKLICVYAI